MIKRLNRIEGQVRGVRGMIEEDRDCIEVLRQMVSVSGAFRGVWMQMMGVHLRGCMKSTALEDGNRDRLIDELIEHLERIW